MKDKETLLELTLLQLRQNKYELIKQIKILQAKTRQIDKEIKQRLQDIG